MRASMIILAAAALAASGCASNPGVDRAESYTSEYNRLSDECDSNGGMLVSSGRVTNRPQTDNVCKITGGPSPRLRELTERRP